MLIVGAGGFAREIIDLLEVDEKMSRKNITLFDNINTRNSFFFDEFKIFRNYKEIQDYSKENKDLDFTIGFGDITKRKKIFEKFRSLGFRPYSILSAKSSVAQIDVQIGAGAVIMQNVTVTTGVFIGKATLINIGTIISHDVRIGDFCEIACGVRIAGRCEIGNNVFIGTGAIINPDITIGDNVFIGSGTVIIKNVPNNTKIVGNPGRPIG